MLNIGLGVIGLLLILSIGTYFFGSKWLAWQLYCIVAYWGFLSVFVLVGIYISIPLSVIVFILWFILMIIKVPRERRADKIFMNIYFSIATFSWLGWYYYIGSN